MKKAAIGLFALLQTVSANLFGSVEQLTDSNFDSRVAVEEGSIWLVAFFNPYNQGAELFAPKFENAARNLRSQGYKLEFGAADVASNPETGYYFGIGDAPSIKIFQNKDGQISVNDYLGEYEEQDFQDYCVNVYRANNFAFTPVPEGYVEGDLFELTDDNFDDIVYNSNEIWLIKFAAEWCYHCNLMKPAWVNAAKEMGAKVRFGIIDADNNRGLARRFNIQRLPTLTYFHAGYDKVDADVKPFTGDRKEADILDFANSLYNEYSENPSEYAFKLEPIEVDMATRHGHPGQTCDEAGCPYAALAAEHGHPGQDCHEAGCPYAAKLSMQEEHGHVGQSCEEAGCPFHAMSVEHGHPGQSCEEAGCPYPMQESHGHPGQTCEEAGCPFALHGKIDDLYNNVDMAASHGHPGQTCEEAHCPYHKPSYHNHPGQSCEEAGCPYHAMSVEHGHPGQSCEEAGCPYAAMAIEHGHPGQSCKEAGCPFAFADGDVPEDVHGLCHGESLCVVAFLDNDHYRDAMVRDLQNVANAVEQFGVKVFWIESGSNQGCEQALRIDYMRDAVIAFWAEEYTFTTLKNGFSVDNITSFISQILEYGIQEAPMPMGGINLRNAY